MISGCLFCFMDRVRGTERGKLLCETRDLTQRRKDTRFDRCVAQICNLLYRRIAFGRACEHLSLPNRQTRSRLKICDTADCKSALHSPCLARNSFLSCVLCVLRASAVHLVLQLLAAALPDLESSPCEQPFATP